MNKYDTIMNRLAGPDSNIYGPDSDIPPQTPNPLSEAELDALEQELGMRYRPTIASFLETMAASISAVL